MAAIFPGPVRIRWPGVLPPLPAMPVFPGPPPSHMAPTWLNGSSIKPCGSYVGATFWLYRGGGNQAPGPASVVSTVWAGWGRWPFATRRGVRALSYGAAKAAMLQIPPGHCRQRPWRNPGTHGHNPGRYLIEWRFPYASSWLARPYANPKPQLVSHHSKGSCITNCACDSCATIAGCERRPTTFLHTSCRHMTTLGGIGGSLRA